MAKVVIQIRAPFCLASRRPIFFSTAICVLAPWGLRGRPRLRVTASIVHPGVQGQLSQGTADKGFPWHVLPADADEPTSLSWNVTRLTGATLVLPSATRDQELPLHCSRDIHSSRVLAGAPKTLAVKFSSICGGHMQARCELCHALGKDAECTASVLLYIGGRVFFAPRAVSNLIVIWLVCRIIAIRTTNMPLRSRFVRAKSPTDNGPSRLHIGGLIFLSQQL